MGLQEPEGPRKIDDKWLDVPVCSLCNSEMKRLSNSTSNIYIPVYACDGGVNSKKPCDGYVVEYGQR